MKKTFIHQDQEFEIRTLVDANCVRVRVYHNDAHVGLEVSALSEVARDFEWQRGDSLLEELMAIAEAEIRRANFPISKGEGETK